MLAPVIATDRLLHNDETTRCANTDQSALQQNGRYSNHLVGSGQHGGRVGK
jgi:hypothetical protein